MKVYSGKAQHHKKINKIDLRVDWKWQKRR